MNPIKLKIEQNPLKYYLWLLFSFTIFFIALLLLIGVPSLLLILQLIESLFNSTNAGTLTSILFPPSENGINLEFLVSLIALLGGFGGFCSIFFSIRDGNFSEREELRHGFEGILMIIFFLDILLFVSLITGNWQTSKIPEVVLLSIFPVIAILFAIAFSLIFTVMEENYENRNSLINFLTKTDERIIISRLIDSSSRLIIKDFENNSIFIFLLMIAMVFFGFYQGFNPLSIISMILFTLLLYIAYSRMVFLSGPTANIKLIRHDPLETTFSENGLPQCLSNIFILKESTNYTTILTNTQGDKKIICLSRNCICSIHDNDYKIFEDGKHPLFVWFFTRALRLLLFVFLFWIIFTVLVYIIPTKQSWILFFIVLIISVLVSFYLTNRLKIRFYRRIEKILERFIFHI